MTTTVKDLIEATKKTRPGFSRALKEMAEAGLMSPDQKKEMPQGMEGEPPDAPPEVVDTIDHEQAILDAAKACLDDTALSNSEKMAKIKKLLGILDMADAGAGPEGSAGEGDEKDDDKGPEGKAGEGDDKKDDDEKKESRWWKTPAKKGTSNLREKLATLEARDLLRRVADAAKITLSEGILSAVKPGITEAEAKALVENIRAVSAPAPGQQPRSAPPPVRTPPAGSKDTSVSLEESSKRWTKVA